MTGIRRILYAVALLGLLVCLVPFSAATAADAGTAPAISNYCIAPNCLQINGVRFSAAASGVHRFQLSGGAYDPWPAGSHDDVWNTTVYFYINRGVEWAPIGTGGEAVPANPDFALGCPYATNYPTFEEAEAASIGQYLDVPLAAGDVVAMIAPDGESGYCGNGCQGYAWILIQAPEPWKFTYSITPSCEQINGVPFTAAAGGSYRFSILDGAYDPWPAGTRDDIWNTTVYFYLNRGVEWAPIGMGGEGVPASPDFALGCPYATNYPTFEEAQAASIGQYVDVRLTAGDVVTMIAPDGETGYCGNGCQGATTIGIERDPSLPGWDLTQDGKVDYKDLAILGACYGACAGDPWYDYATDLNESGCIDYIDLAILGAHYGEHM